MKKRAIIRLRVGCLGLVLLGTFLWFRGEWLWLHISNWHYDHHSFDREIRDMAYKHGLDSRLVKAVIYQESRFNAMARGAAGEVGLMQVLPQGAVADWAKSNGVAAPSAYELHSPELNIDIGCWYLARAMNRWAEFDRAAELALCQYNAGPSRAAAWRPESFDGEVLDRIAISSTRKYVAEIMERYRYYLDNNPFQD